MAFLRLERKASAPKASASSSAEHHGRGRRGDAGGTATTAAPAAPPAADKPATIAVLLNADVIHHVEPLTPDGCRILTTAGETLDVVESFMDVAKMVGVLPRH